MLSRSLFSVARFAAVRPTIVANYKFTMPLLHRNFITIIENDDEDVEVTRKDIADFNRRAQFMGCDTHPYYRRVRVSFF